MGAENLPGRVRPFGRSVFQQFGERSATGTPGMGSGERRGSSQGKDLAQRFTYEHLEQIPPGVNPLQLDFLRDASMVGAFSWVRVNTAKMIAEYYTTEATYADLAKEYGITVPAVRERITRGLGKMRKVLYKEKPELTVEDRYPLEQIQKGKERIEVLKSEQSRKRISEASKNTIRRPARLP